MTNGQKARADLLLGSPLTPTMAKAIIHDELTNRNLPFTKLSARTIDFSDLASAQCIFVKIHGWQPNPAWSELRKIAVKYGFRIED